MMMWGDEDPYTPVQQRGVRGCVQSLVYACGLVGVILIVHAILFFLRFPL